MPGYANRVLKLSFPHLTDDPEGDPIWVTMRNPKLVPPDQLRGEDDGPPDTDVKKSVMESMLDIFSRLILGWRVYDAADLKIDENGDPLDQELLGEVTLDNVRKLPQEIVTDLAERVTQAIRPS